MNLSFVLVAHESPESLRILIETLLAGESDVYVHYDARSPHNLEQASQEWRLDRFPGKLFHAKRVKVTWGEWSIVQATLNCLTLARQQGYNADYFMLISGSCMPIKPLRLLRQFLAFQPDTDFIEVVDGIEKRWVKRGLQSRRWEKYHYVNWRAHPSLFDFSLKLQELLKIKRRLPLRQKPFMGSQWWCLRAKTIDLILSLLEKEPALARFYRRTWVPDELFFQTMVGNLIPSEQTSSASLTRYKFNSWGMPRVYYDDDLPELLAEDTFFARKISPRAKTLRQSLSEVCAMSEVDYGRMLADPQNENMVRLRERLDLKRVLSENSWFALASSPDNVTEYIKSIPNDMVVLCGMTEDQKRLNLLHALSKFPDAVVLGELFGTKTAGLSQTTESMAESPRKNPSPPEPNWHFYLGELAYRASGKTLVFSLGANPLPYLEILRWKPNLTALVLDTEPSAPTREKYLQALYLNSKIMHLLMNGSPCRSVRASYRLLQSTINNELAPSDSLDLFLERLKLAAERLTSFNQLRKIPNHYDFLKAIPKPIIIIYAADPKIADAVLDYLGSNLNACVLRQPFAAIPINDNAVDWHFHLGYLSVNAREELIALSMDSKHVNYLEAMRWKKDLAVFVFESQESNMHAPQDLFKMFRSHITQQEVLAATIRLNELLADRHCKVYRFYSFKPHLIDHAVSLFFDVCNDEQIASSNPIPFSDGSWRLEAWFRKNDEITKGAIANSDLDPDFLR